MNENEKQKTDSTQTKPKEDENYSKLIYEKLCEIKTVARWIAVLTAGCFAAIIAFICLS